MYEDSLSYDIARYEANCDKSANDIEIFCDECEKILTPHLCILNPELTSLIERTANDTGIEHSKLYDIAFDLIRQTL